MAKIPSYREQDEIPKRNSDLEIPVPWSNQPLKVSGDKMTETLLLVALLGLVFWHDSRSESSAAATRQSQQRELTANREVQMLQASIQAQNVCVNTLSEAEKKMHREEGKFCPSPIDDIRAYVEQRRKELGEEKPGKE